MRDDYDDIMAKFEALVKGGGEFFYDDGSFDKFEITETGETFIVANKDTIDLGIEWEIINGRIKYIGIVEGKDYDSQAGLDIYFRYKNRA